MANSTFEKILVKNDVLGCITDKVKFAVTKSGQNITSQAFKAISETTSSHVYTVQVPSLETIINREVLWKSTVTLKISNPSKDANEFCVNHGVTDALCSFSITFLSYDDVRDDKQCNSNFKYARHITYSTQIT
jgi:hypothetical protein